MILRWARETGLTALAAGLVLDSALPDPPGRGPS